MLFQNRQYLNTDLRDLDQRLQVGRELGDLGMVLAQTGCQTRGGPSHPVHRLDGHQTMDDVRQDMVAVNPRSS